MNRLSDLRTAVELSLKNRGTRFIVVDEAAHIINRCQPQQLQPQLDTLKSLSNKCGVQWVLLGSYDLFDLMSLSGQLARRAHVVHFNRYRLDSDTEVRWFNGCLKQLAKGLPALQNLDLLPYAEAFHQTTLGCIGTLRDVLMRLNSLVASKGWSEDALCTALLTDAQVTQITREVLEGEERIAPGLHRHSLVFASSQPQKAA